MFLVQRYGDGPNNELSLESSGDFTRQFGYVHFANFTTPSDQSTGNLLNSAWYQPEEVFPVNGTPEVRQHAFWVPVDEHYYRISKSLKVFTSSFIHEMYTCMKFYVFKLLSIKFILISN